MDKQKQIEEMTKIVCDRYKNGRCDVEDRVCSNKCTVYLRAEVLYKLGYRKIPEGSVVLTREEHQKYLAYKIIEPQIRGCLDRERELEKRLQEIAGEFAKEYLAVSEQTRKETAEKFAERVKEETDHGISAIYDSTVDEICKEITQGDKTPCKHALKNELGDLYCGNDKGENWGDFCAVCGEYVPEGRQVCPKCEKE